MTTHRELLDAVTHVGSVTGDPAAWKRGLTSSDVALLGVVVAPENEVAAVLAKIKANHPTLFDPRTGAPVVPTAAAAIPAEEQQGVGVAAIKKAETDLAHQNSAVAQLDLLVIAAVLNAHSTSTQGGAELRRLQQEIENAVRVRTDLDTPAGARDFQRYLIGKLREIGALVHSAGLDDNSKAVLASAWTALYESSRRTTAAETSPAAAAAGTAPGPVGLGELPAYGADLGSDPLLEQLLAQESPAPAPPAPLPPPPSAPAAASIPQTGIPSPSMLGGPGGALPSALPGMPRAEEDSSVPQRTAVASPDSLDSLLSEAESVLAEDIPPGEEPPEDKQPADAEPDEEPTVESSEIRLPDGDVITAPNPQLAKVINSALAGTPIAEAFHRNGLGVPPPGTPVAHPVDPADVDTGDVGMFTDRLAVALDRTRALQDGQIGPLAGVSGPSFLGWIHPPSPTDTAPAGTDTPAPTRPATTPAS
ncbi:hypothetical protein BVC93_11530 [Mycobacterium sp. MS1601]|uniref:DUF4226 domain-containing protein n=1 Tax=Mycobacterium sp. MS1601 TaxID=1936029 RepID=UPI00097943CE|nr:DUF4226 domain-containing protein [Mycobacterium sp. MS1601]AQA02959.1 hypothetical protein BVC93_11530 [Mycobacterium sp. MS1601]